MQSNFGPMLARDYDHGIAKSWKDSIIESPNVIVRAGAKNRPDMAAKYIGKMDFSGLLLCYTIGFRSVNCNAHYRAQNKINKKNRKELYENHD